MSKEYLCAAKRIVLTSVTRFFGEATVTGETAGDREAWQSSRLSRLVVNYTKGTGSGRPIEIPAKALHDAGPIYLNRLEFRDEESVRQPGPGLYLVAFAPHQLEPERWEDKTLHFIFRNGIFERLTIRIPLPEAGSSQGQAFNY